MKIRYANKLSIVCAILLALGSVVLAPGANTASAEPADAAFRALLRQPKGLPDLWHGSSSAPVTIIEYVSLNCPHCARFYKDVLPSLTAKYISTGKVRFVMRD
jgi:protein-disulfide isomerase